MATKTLTVELSADLYSKFLETVTEKGGCWRGQETFTEALESAVTAALMLFLQNLDGEAELPEFRDYILEKYPELDEDLITMIEDLILRKQQHKGGDVYVRRLKVTRRLIKIKSILGGFKFHEKEI